MHDINLIDHAITFMCGAIVGAAAVFIEQMVVQIWKDRHAPKSYDMQSAMVKLEMLSKIRQCLYKWSMRYAGSDHTRNAVATTKDLIHWIDEQFLNQ